MSRIITFVLAGFFFLFLASIHFFLNRGFKCAVLHQQEDPFIEESPWPPPREVTKAIADLQGEDGFERYSAAIKLAEIGPDAAWAVPELIKALKSRLPLTKPYSGGAFTPYDQTPREARKALVSIGQVSIRSLRQAITDNDTLTRLHAAHALWCLKQNTEEVLPIICRAWKNPRWDEVDECIRIEASQALGDIGKKEPDTILPIVFEVLGNPDSRLWYEGLVPLGMMAASDARALSALIGTLADRREGIGTWAGHELRRVGPKAYPSLIAALRDKDPELRWRAAWTIGGLESEPEIFVTPLKTAAQDPNPEVRKWSLWALENYSPKKP
jgi:HEAT repeat protein